LNVSAEDAPDTAEQLRAISDELSSICICLPQKRRPE
jgi:hypothetical protein